MRRWHTLVCKNRCCYPQEHRHAGKGSSGSSAGGNVASSQSLHLTTIYASDQITFTSLQQATKFSDDTFTSFGEHSNYVRLNFKEQQTAHHSSFFTFREAFHLILPDKSVVDPENEQNDLAPDQDVVRTNWVDFPTNGPVDLSQLTLRLIRVQTNSSSIISCACNQVALSSRPTEKLWDHPEPGEAMRPLAPPFSTVAHRLQSESLSQKASGHRPLHPAASGLDDRLY